MNSKINRLKRTLLEIHKEFNGVCLSCYLGQEVHEEFPCPTIRAFIEWYEKYGDK
jgi:hypothetical protein